MTPSRGSDIAPGDLFFPVSVSRPLDKQKSLATFPTETGLCFKNSIYLMNCLKRPTVL